MKTTSLSHSKALTTRSRIPTETTILYTSTTENISEKSTLLLLKPTVKSVLLNLLPLIREERSSLTDPLMPMLKTENNPNLFLLVTPKSSTSSRETVITSQDMLSASMDNMMKTISLIWVSTLLLLLKSIIMPEDLIF